MAPLGAEVFMRRFLTDLFVDVRDRDDVESVARTLRTVMLALSLAVWSPVFAPLYLWAGAKWSAVLIAAAGLACLLLLFALRWGVPHGLIVQLLVGVLFAAIGIVALLTGGIAAPVMAWLCVVPIFAVVLGGPASGIVWMLAAIATAVVLFAVDQAGVTFTSEAKETGQQWLHVASLCGIVGCATLLTWIFLRSEREARTDVERARHTADIANRAKSDFLAKMTHEIRTPMNGVIGMAQLALSTELTPQQRDYIEAAKESAEALLVVVNDILEFARMEAGRMELRVQAFHIRDLVRRTTTLLAVRADPQKLSISWEVDENVPHIVIADMGRLRQVLINLVGNAIKFTPAGEVAARIALAGDQRASASVLSQAEAASKYGASTSAASRTRAPETVWLLLEVRDTGVGIPEDQQERIFKEFEQVDQSTQRMFGGTGLGLSITRGLVALMGGRIELESRLNLGSTFRVTLPVAIGTEADLVLDDSSCVALAGAEAEEEELHGLCVLVVDDNLTNQVLIRGLLLRQGCEVTIAERGESALERIAGGQFDLVFMDVEMPGMDGFETARRIREQERGTDHLPIFALTAHAEADCAANCLAAGMDGFLTKPLQMPEVLSILQRIRLSKEKDAKRSAASSSAANS
jgi:signal transduction histidine kinase/AmiR/NasT family two-component response regulator